VAADRLGTGEVAVGDREIEAQDDPPRDEAAKAKLRKQILEWLKAEYAEWSRFLESNPAQVGPLAARNLMGWQRDADLAGIRDEKELARLPEGEHSAFKQLWSDVDSLLTKARAGELTQAAIRVRENFDHRLSRCRVTGEKIGAPVDRASRFPDTRLWEPNDA
jgi:hypothetical protein